MGLPGPKGFNVGHHSHECLTCYVKIASNLVVILFQGDPGKAGEQGPAGPPGQRVYKAHSNN